VPRLLRTRHGRDTNRRVEKRAHSGQETGSAPSSWLIAGCFVHGHACENRTVNRLGVTSEQFVGAVV